MGNQTITREQIEKRAYELYLECGCDGGHEVEHWLAAEAELLLPQQQSQTETTPPQKTKTAVAGGSSQATTRA